MSYLVLARKFRPQNFANVIGQEHIRKVLKNSLLRNKVAHAYLFAGPRGVGKTSLARIFAKSLNCQDLKNGEPCLECANCREIAQGVSLAVREIDGASHNSVENVRELVENFRSLPPPASRFKIYIIDEVHMLSTSAFNALLKSLEEPPPNTVFILATTEVHKIPDTVISRCQRHDFRALDVATIARALHEIIKAEGRKAEEGVTELVARYSEGSLRDSQSLLERIMVYDEDEKAPIKLEAARQILGVAGPVQLERIWAAIRNEKADEALKLVREVFTSGVDVPKFLRELIESLRAEFNRLVFEQPNAVQEIAEVEQLLSLSARGADSALRSVFTEAATEALVVRLALRRLREKPANSPTANGRGEKSGPKASLSTPSSANLAGGPKEEDAAKQLATDAPVNSLQPLEWESFLSSTRIMSQKIMLEQLKRLSVEKFVPGVLSGSGPDFSIEYLSRQDIISKLQQELSEYHPAKEAKLWRIEFRKQISAGNSVYEREQLAQKERTAQRQRSALEHPSVKSLQRAFPGSNVEKVVVRK